MEQDVPDPRRIVRDESLHEGYELHIVLSRFGNIFASLSHRCLKIESFWFKLGDGDTDLLGNLGIGQIEPWLLPGESFSLRLRLNDERLCNVLGLNAKTTVIRAPPLGSSLGFYIHVQVRK